MSAIAPPLSTNTENTSGGGLFDLVGITNKIVLDNVYVNGLHALRCFKVRNRSPFPMIVRLRSNLGSQIAFQLNNENLPTGHRPRPRRTMEEPNASSISEGPAKSEDPSSISRISSVSFTSMHSSDSNPCSLESDPDFVAALDSSLLRLSNGAALTMNTSDASAMLNFQNAGGNQINQLFNYVNYIDQLHLSPFETKTAVLAFLPSPNASRNQYAASSSDDINARLVDDSGSAVKDNSYEYAEVNGLLFFYGAAIKDDKSAAIGADIINLEGKNELTIPGNETKDSIESTIIVKFRSRVCRTVLWTDISEIGINFEDCVVGGTYFKDFTVWNKSEIDLYWGITQIDNGDSKRHSWVKFTDNDTGEYLEFKPLPSFSYRRIRVTFRPLEVGEFVSEIQLENFNDNLNSETIQIRAVVRYVLEEEPLAVSSGSSLDFGVCYGGMWTKQKLVVKNISELPLDLAFKAENADVVFDLLAEEPIEMKTGSRDVLSPPDTISTAMAQAVKSRERSLASSSSSSRATSPSRPYSRDSRSTSSLDFADEQPFRRTDSRSSLLRFERDTSKGGDIEDESEAREIDEVTLKPGVERTFEVSFRPEKSNSVGNAKAGTLSKTSFRLLLTYSHVGNSVKQRKVIQCLAKICTSFIEVTPKTLNFGDVDVGTLKSLCLRIKNQSDLIARIELRYMSKIINCYRGEIAIPPKQTSEVKVDIFPRKVNPDYRKQINVINTLNRDNDQTIDLVSNNIDKNRVTFHSIFYRILTPASTNFLDFGTVVLNNPTVRTFTIENISKKPLSLELRSSLPDEIQIYIIPPNQKQMAQTAVISSDHSKREKLIEDMDRRSGMKAANEQKQNVNTAANGTVNAADEGPRAEYLDLASSISAMNREGKNSPRKHPIQLKSAGLRTASVITSEAKLTDNQSGSNLFIDSQSVNSVNNASPPFAAEERSALVSDMESIRSASLHQPFNVQHTAVGNLVAAIESLSQNVPKYARSTIEEKYVRTVRSLRYELDRALATRKLVPIRSVQLEPDSSEYIIVIFTPNGKNRPYVEGRPRKSDAKIFIRLAEFDCQVKQAAEYATMLDGNLNNIPVRELMIQASLCRSIIDVGQKHISFGILATKERRHKSLILYNRSDMPVCYAIKKTGSVASGDLHFADSRLGIIRGYGKKEIVFIFNPSLPGIYFEKIVVENIFDRENDQSVALKAQIRKPSNFFIKSLQMDFGPCLVNEKSLTQQMVITNLSRQPRTIEVRYDQNENKDKPWDLVFSFELNSEQMSNNDNVSKEIEDELEHLEQKLKIAKRKGYKDKVKKILGKLSKLRGEEASPYVPDEVSRPGSAIDDNTQETYSFPKFKRTVYGIVFDIEPRKTRTVDVVFRLSLAKNTEIPRAFPCVASLFVHETKNVDVVKVVKVSATGCLDHEAYVTALEVSCIQSEPLGSRPLTPTEDKNNYIEIEEEQRDQQNDDKFDLIPDSTAVLEVMPKMLDLGKIVVLPSSTYYFTLRNPSESVVDYVIILPDSSIVLKEGTHGVLLPKEAIRLYFSLNLAEFGRQIHSFIILDRTNHHSSEFTLTFHSLQEQYLFFDDLKDASEMDFGYCYIDQNKKQIKTVSFVVSNVSNDDIFVNVRSNLVQQVTVYSNKALTLPLEIFKLPKKESITLFLALDPNVSASTLHKAESRKLVGGVKFSVLVPKDGAEISDDINLNNKRNIYETLVSQTVRFVATVGESFIEVIEPFIDFGTSFDQENEFNGIIHLKNISDSLPVHYEVRSSANLTVKDPSGTLQPNCVGKESTLEFQLRTNIYGLFEEQLQIYNLNNSNNTCVVNVRMFSDPSVIKVYSKEFASGAHVSCCSWECIYLSEVGTNVDLVSPSTVKLDRAVCIQNLTSRSLDIIPSIDFPAVLSDFSGNIGHSNVDLSSLHVTVDPGETKTLTLRPISSFTSLLSSEAKVFLLGGQKVFFEGAIHFKHGITGKVLQSMKLTAFCTVSMLHLEPAIINLGKIGQSGRIDDTPFSFSINNVSEAPLLYEIQHSDIVELKFTDNDQQDIVRKTKCLIAMGKQTVSGVLRLRKMSPLSSGSISVPLTISNLWNPNDTHTLKVIAEVAVIQISFKRLTAGELSLPALYYPQHVNESPCDSWFQIVNTSDMEVKFDLNVELSPEISRLVSIEILSRFSNAPLRGITLLPARGSLDVKVRARIDSKTSRLIDISRHLTNPDGITFGKICVNMKHIENETDLNVKEDIPLRGLIVEGQTFELSENQIQFYSNAKSGIDTDTENESDTEWDNKKKHYKLSSVTIFVINKCSCPLRFKVTQELPPSFPANSLYISPLSEDGIGQVQSEGKLALQIEIRNSSIRSFDDIKLHFLDLDSISSQEQTLLVSVLVNTQIRSNLAEFKEQESDDENEPIGLLATPSDRKPKVLVRGCKKIHVETSNYGTDLDRYELDIGQQDLGSNAIVKKIVLENDGDVPLSYRIRVSGALNQDHNWLILSKTNGVLDSAMAKNKSAARDADNLAEYSNACDQISVTVLPSVQNVYVAYIIIENLSYLSDVKLIRVSMEVVSLQSYRRLDQNRVFDVVANGVDNSIDWVDMENIYYYAEHSARSLLIINRESVPLEFTVKHSHINDINTELVFSLSRSTARLFKTITVEPNSSVRVYLRLRVTPDAAQSFNDSEVEIRKVEIYVNCRLVRDYQKTVTLRINCRFPSMKLPHQEFRFVGRPRTADEVSNGFKPHVSPSYHELFVKHIVLGTSHLKIMNDTQYFFAEKTDLELTGKAEEIIQIRPNWDRIKANEQELLKEKYIQEHMIVYNLLRPTEKYWVVLQLNFGTIASFYLPPSTKTSFSFNTVESRILQFIRDFRTEWTEITSGVIKVHEPNEMEPVRFAFQYIVDQLIYYGTKEYTGESYFQLACLLFNGILQSEEAVQYLSKIKLEEGPNAKNNYLACYVKGLAYFLSFFPVSNSSLEALRRIHKQIIN